MTFSPRTASGPGLAPAGGVFVDTRDDVAPEVSVVVPFHASTRHFEHYLAEGLWDGLPVQLVADGASPGHVQRLHERIGGRPQARLHAYAPNEGPAAARRHGAARVETPYCMFCDEDDFLVDGLAACREAAGVLRDEDVLFATLPSVVAFDAELRAGRQYDRRSFDGVTAATLLRHLVRTGEMSALGAGTAFVTADLTALPLVEPFFRVSEDYVMLARLCAAHPERRVRVLASGRYMRLVHTGSLSARRAFSAERAVMNLVSMVVGAAYLAERGELTAADLHRILTERGEVLQQSYGLGRGAAAAVVQWTGGPPPATRDAEADASRAFLEASRAVLPPELGRFGP